MIKSNRATRVPFCPLCWKADSSSRFASPPVSPRASWGLDQLSWDSSGWQLLSCCREMTGLPGTRPLGKKKARDFQVLAGQNAEEDEIKWLLSRCLCRGFFIFPASKAEESWEPLTYKPEELHLLMCCTALITKCLAAATLQLHVAQGWEQPADFAVISCCCCCGYIVTQGGNTSQVASPAQDNILPGSWHDLE